MNYLILSIIIITFVFDTMLSLLNYKYKGAKIPEEVKDVYDEDAYKKWLKYNMEDFRLQMISGPIRLLIILVLLIFNVFPIFFDFAVKFSKSVHIQTLVFLGIYFIIYFIIGIFFSYYSQFSIEERYGFNKTTIKTFIIDKVKSLILTIILGGGIIYLLSLLYHNVGDLFYVLAWVLIIAIILFVNLFYVKLFIPLFNRLQPLEDGELKNKIINFAEKVGYEISKISVINASLRSTKLNAFFSGFGKMKHVVLYDTLIDKMNDDQIVAVLAHEIGHCKKNHITKNIIMSIINISILLFVLLLTINTSTLATEFGFNSNEFVLDDVKFGFGLIIFMLLLSPISIIEQVIISHISRKFEYQADTYAALNGFKKEIQEALIILARENFSNLTPHPLYVAMKYSHPPTAYRIKAIQKIEV